MNQILTVNKDLSIEERINFLKYCADKYESGEPPITDKEYDEEYDELKSLAPQHEFFVSVGGLEEVPYGTVIKHDIIVGSLNKSRNIDEFKEWLKNTFTFSDKVEFLCELKIDGSSLSLIYDKQKLIKAITRGDGFEGFDVTENAKYISNIPKTIPYNGLIEVRGECYKNRHTFYNSKCCELFANPRNYAAGSLNQKNPLITKERELDFVAYECVRKDFNTESEKLKFLNNNGFEIINSLYLDIIKSNNIDEIVEVVSLYMEGIRRDELHYDIDGIVVKLNDCSLAKEMGTTNEGRRPKSHRAVKFPTEKKETILKGIEWSIGRTGALTPIGLLEPIQLCGTMVRRVCLYNLKELERLNLKNLNSRISIEKSGDIVPKVTRLVENGSGPEIEILNNCPICNSELTWDNNSITKWCTNLQCPTKLNESIEYWFKSIGIKGIGQSTIKRLTSELKWNDEPIIQSLPEMYYKLTDNDDKVQYLKNEFGEKFYQNIIDNINSIKDVTLDKFIKALGIGQIGTMSKEIVAIAPTINDIDKLTTDNIIKLDGFALKKAESFINGWNNMKPTIEKLLNHINIIQFVADSDKLKNQQYCFTGSFKNPTRKEMEQMVIDNGGKLSSVSKNLTALIWDNEIQGSKIEKAKKLNIPIISQSEFLSKI